MIKRPVFASLSTGMLLAVSCLPSAMRAGTASQQATQRAVEAGQRGSSTATGIVSQVSCAGVMKIQLDTPEGTRTFRRQPGARLHITSPSHEQENIDPCTSLKGLRVTVQFIPDGGKGMTGTIERMQIL